MLSSKERAALSALAHHHEPVIQVGKKGLTEPLVDETSRALLAHELIKVKFMEGGDLDAPSKELAERSESDVVAIRGHVVILYKRHPEKPRIKLPKNPGEKAAKEAAKEKTRDDG